MDTRTGAQRMATPPASYVGGQSNANTPHTLSVSPFGSPTPKSVAFELLFPESPQYRARLPMRVQIFPHDTTDSIITTVKNFYGLYAGPGGAKGVSFEDDQGNTLIARYENLRNNMIVGDGAPGSVSSRTKSEHIGNTEISLDNIVEGGRRKRAKFESSELPLFAPPQMPAATSNSSVSPARRMEHHRASLPFTHPGSNPFTNPQTLQSPQSFSNGFGQPGTFSTPAPGSRRTRGGAAYPPHPTVGSCMSEEDKDVAMQLIRLGEMSNISHGRTSASTLDDTFSGRADAASSTGATSDEESESEPELPPARRQKREASPILPPGAMKRIRPHLDDILPSQDSSEPSGDEADYEFNPGHNDASAEGLDQKPKMPKARSMPSIIMGKPKTSASGAKVNKTSKSKIPRPGQVVKSKKSASRYGRHMGVPVKKDDMLAETPILPTLMAGGQGSPDKSKKRKR
ncbi:hypothetical protein M7I_4744 [Glarea lozoyensis 74030]|uniref:Uncharacterized protein n=1 Tax=Glarea lozoyensis (strain ATCC 74030 / MF5533) TaxID=1104152 RepID=H0EQ03_GLAL7|nr:hypothetical protein M7I_4744 [Glarea lozoyensis 74030]